MTETLHSVSLPIPLASPEIESYGSPRTPNTPSSKRRSWKWGPRDSLSQRLKIGKPGSKRFQRNFNKMFLEGQIPDLTEEEKMQLLRVEWRSGFTCLWEDPQNMEIWQKFMKASEEIQRQFLEIMSVDLLEFGSDDDEDDSDDVDDIYNPLCPTHDDYIDRDAPIFVGFEPLEDGCLEGSLDEFYEELVDEDCEYDGDIEWVCWYPTSPQEAFNNLDRHTRFTLRRVIGSPWLTALDTDLFQFANSSPEDAPLLIPFKDSFRRLVAHKLCHFYSLVSESVLVDGEKAIFVDKPNTLYVPTCSLTDFLSTRSG